MGATWAFVCALRMLPPPPPIPLGLDVFMVTSAAEGPWPYVGW